MKSARVAQWIEQKFPKLLVGGSIPLPGTKINFVSFVPPEDESLCCLQHNCADAQEPAVRIAAARLASRPLPGTIFDLKQ